MEDDKLYMNGQEVRLKTPGTEALKDILIVSKAIGKMPKPDTKGKTEEQIQKEMEESNVNFLDYISEKEMDSLTNLINHTLKRTFKDGVTDDISSWAMENSMKIISIVLNACSPKQKTDDQERADILKKKMQDAKSTGVKEE